MANDTVNVQRGIVGAGSDDDTYVLSASLIDANAEITISDVEGSNKIQLIGGLTISSSIVAGDTAQLTLSNGAVVTVLGASTMSYEVGGNPLTGTAGVTKDYSTFVADVLGTTVPTEGTSTGGESTVNEDGTSSGGEASYSLAAAATSVDEGSTATFTLTTANVTDGTAVAYTISGVDAADVDGGSLTGTATVTGGTATISVALTADLTTEGAETLTVTIDGQSATASTTVNDSSTAPTSQTFSLTQAVDTIVGGDGDDTINSFIDGNVSTMGILDSIDGGAGTDTFTVLGADLDDFAESKITNVEKFLVQSTSTGSINLASITGETHITDLNSSGTTTSTWDNLGTGVELSVAGQAAAATVVFDYASDALSGSSDSQSLELNSSSGTVNFTGTSTTNGLETLAVNSTGGASSLTAFGAVTGLTTLNVTGDQNLTFTTDFAQTTLTTVNASAFTGNLNIDLDAGANVTVTGGTGDDNLDLEGGLDSNDTIDLGAGTDTLIVNAPVTGTNWSKVSNVEILGMDITGTDDQDMDLVSGINTVSVVAVNAAADDLTITDAANAFTLNLDGTALAAVAAGTGANEDIDNVTVNLKTNTAADTLTVNIGGTAGGVNVDGFLPSTQYETVTVVSGGTAENTIQSIDTALNNMTFTGSTAIEVTSTGSLAGVADFSAMTAAVTTTTSTTAITVSGGTAADSLTSGVVANGVTQVINGGAGNDTITSGNLAIGGILTVNGDAGDDTITFNAANNGASVHNVDGGAGFDTIALGQHAGTLDDVISTVTTVADADKITGFVTTTDDFDYNGTVKNDSATTITASSDTTFAAALAADADATVFIATTNLSGAAATDLTALADATSATTIASTYATFEASLVASLGTVTSLDTVLSTTESALLVVDNGTDSAILRVTNTDTSVANTLTAAEVELVAVLDATAALATGDFI